MCFCLLILYLYEMMDIHSSYCGNHFMICVNEIIMLYTLNLALCVSYIPVKLEEEKKEK